MGAEISLTTQSEALFRRSPADWALASVRIIAFYAIYIALDKISYIEPIQPFDITPWNPGLGFCVAVAALWGGRTLALTLLAPLLADAVNRGFPATPTYSLGVGVLTVMEVLLVSWGGRWLRKVATDTPFAAKGVSLLTAAVPAAFVSAAAHAVSLRFLGLLRPEQLFDSVNRLWIGDIIGVVIVTPLVFFLFGLSRNRTFKIARLPEMTAQAVAVLVTLWAIFGLQMEQADDYFYILYLPTIWIVLRHGEKGAIVLNTFLQAAIIISLAWLGPAGTTITALQAMLIVFAVSSLTLGLSVDQIREANRKLRAREDELAASVKAAATSELAGTLAHEISHPLGAISNYASAIHHMLIQEARTDTSVISLLDKLLKEVGRATDAVHHLRDFFRSGTLVFERVDLGDLAREAISLLEGRMGSRVIAPRLSGLTGPHHVLGDKIQLHAVIHNLLINSIEAAQQTNMDNRVIAVTVSKSSTSISLSVDDSGPGVPDDVKDHIFEPLITTKKDGLGLGLSMSRSIVIAHGGRIELETSPLGGARFVVTLPIPTD